MITPKNPTPNHLENQPHHPKKSPHRPRPHQHKLAITLASIFLLLFLFNIFESTTKLNPLTIIEDDKSSEVPKNSKNETEILEKIENDLLQTSNSFLKGATTTNTTTSQNPLLFIGLLTTPSKFPRRSLIRTTYLHLLPPSTTFKFVLGRPKTPDEHIQVALEQQRYGDMLLLDIDENMNEGKTWKFFDTVFHSGGEKYEFVVKMDDDVFVHLPNLVKVLEGWQGVRGVYFGRDVVGAGFMAGLGYGLSWDLVEFIALDKDVERNIKGQEDATVRNWINGKVHKYLSEDVGIYDSPFATGKGWSKGYIPETIFIHQLKNTSWFLDAAKHFLL